ncbi:MAG: DUF2804 domain-containing protein [Deltaproteobacteria bacterium]|nr:DUF2804 domain-containing protein [Deltaproteobacteria bacterium]
MPLIRPDLPPTSLLNTDGSPQFGVYRAPFPEVDLDRAKVPGWLGPLSLWRRKEWHHYAIVSPELFVTLAVVEARYLQTAWLQVVDRTTGERFEHKRQAPTLGLSLARSLWDEHTLLRSRGFFLDAHAHLESGEHRLKLSVAARGGLPPVRAELHLDARVEPLAVVLPVGRGRAMYSHKVPLPASGWVEVGDRKSALDPAHATAILDIHKAHYPRHTWWKWATFAGRAADGRRVAVNLTHNLNPREDQWTENAVWIEDRVYRLGPASFQVGRRGTPWQLHTDDGLDLSFTPAGERAENLRLGLVRSVFRQPYGSFSGVIPSPEGPLALWEGFGLCEDHDARW